MPRNIAKPFYLKLSMIDITPLKPKYKCFYGEDVELVVDVINEANKPLDISETSAKVYYITDDHSRRQDSGITYDPDVVGRLYILVKRNYLYMGSNIVRVVLFDKDQEVYLQPAEIICLETGVGETPETPILPDMDVKNEISTLHRIKSDLSYVNPIFDDHEERIQSITEHCTGGNGTNTHSHSNKTVIDSISNVKVDKWDNYEGLIKNNTEQLESNVQEVNALKNNKADKSYVDTKDQDLLRQIGQGVTDEQLKNAVQSKVDDGTIGSIQVGLNTIRNSNIKDGEISVNKTDFITSTNMFDKAKVKIGVMLVNGIEQVNVDYFTSELIRVEPNTKYYRVGNNSSGLDCEYDINGIYLRAVSAMGGSEFTTGANTGYIRISRYKSLMDKIALYKYDLAYYTPYKPSLKTSDLITEIKDYDKKILCGNNLFNQNSACNLQDKCMSDIGVMKDFSTSIVSYFIEIEPSVKYSITNCINCLEYSKEKSLIACNKNGSFITNKYTKYVVISAYKGKNVMLNKGDSIPFEEYYNALESDKNTKYLDDLTKKVDNINKNSDVIDVTVSLSTDSNILIGSWINPANGQLYTNDNTIGYRATLLIDVENNVEYYGYEVKSYALYDSDGNYISGSGSSTLPKVQRFKITNASAKKIRLNFNNNDDGAFIKLGNSNINGVCFGDSIFGNRPKPIDIPTYMQLKSGFKFYNCGFGGTHASTHFNVNYDKFSFCNLVDAIVSKDFTEQDQAILNESLGWLYPYNLQLLKEIDFNSINIVTIAYGTNDFTSSDLIDNPSNLQDKATYLGALRYGIEKLLTSYPHLKIVLLTPTYRWWDDGDSDVKQFNGKTLVDFKNALIEFGKEYKLPVINNYDNANINKINRTIYIADKTHHNSKGAELIGLKTGGEIYTLF